MFLTLFTAKETREQSSKRISQRITKLWSLLFLRTATRSDTHRAYGEFNNTVGILRVIILSERNEVSLSLSLRTEHQAFEILACKFHRSVARRRKFTESGRVKYSSVQVTLARRFSWGCVGAPMSFIYSEIFGRDAAPVETKRQRQSTEYFLSYAKALFLREAQGRGQKKKKNKGEERTRGNVENERQDANVGRNGR